MLLIKILYDPLPSLKDNDFYVKHYDGFFSGLIYYCSSHSLLTFTFAWNVYEKECFVKWVAEVSILPLLPITPVWCNFLLIYVTKKQIKLLVLSWMTMIKTMHGSFVDVNLFKMYSIVTLITTGFSLFQFLLCFLYSCV